MYEIVGIGSDSYIRIEMPSMVTVSAAMELYRQMAEVPEYRDGMPAIWDMRHSNIGELSAEEIKELSAYRDDPPIREGALVATVVSSEGERMIAKLINSSFESAIDQTRRVFRSLEEAEAWIRSERNAASGDR
ncbi:hypothetical protein HH303_08940 [Rhodospirillaceae bacterium KN72]|uniref:STAS/SEC14 domain-containing protein n=1 Tax=Pacificispira spongiicola TaxID=2729598 RepID=A0A7Y0DZT2_9PROT|nr:hypothetical protein [Pacificispira spongiicola]NMM44605.1 hypothetical protein [Pacificispira spongiicola]